MAEVVIYTRDFCYYSEAAKELLTRKGVAFHEINASGNRELRQQMIERANGGSTFPQVFIGETHVGGCDELYALEEAGKLDPLLLGAALKRLEPGAGDASISSTTAVALIAAWTIAPLAAGAWRTQTRDA